MDAELSMAGARPSPNSALVPREAITTIHPIADLAELFSVSRATLYHEIARGRHDSI